MHTVGLVIAALVIHVKLALKKWDCIGELEYERVNGCRLEGMLP